MKTTTQSTPTFICKNRKNEPLNLSTDDIEDVILKSTILIDLIKSHYYDFNDRINIDYTHHQFDEYIIRQLQSLEMSSFDDVETLIDIVCFNINPLRKEDYDESLSSYLITKLIYVTSLLFEIVISDCRFYDEIMNEDEYTNSIIIRCEKDSEFSDLHNKQLKMNQSEERRRLTYSFLEEHNQFYMTYLFKFKSQYFLKYK